ncbi:hypothetical protein [Bacillus mojavensis]
MGNINLDMNNFLKALSIEETATYIIGIEKNLFSDHEITVEKLKKEIIDLGEDYFGYSTDHECINLDEFVNLLEKHEVEYVLE